MYKHPFSNYYLSKVGKEGEDDKTGVREEEGGKELGREGDGVKAGAREGGGKRGRKEVGREKMFVLCRISCILSLFCSCE